MRISGRQGLGVGLSFGVLLVLVEYFLKKVSLKNMFACLIGLIVGLAAAYLLVLITSAMVEGDGNVVARSMVAASSGLTLGYLGMAIAYKKRDEFSFLLPAGGSHAWRSGSSDVKILDTNVIIDGRILDICKTGFVDGTLIIPRFVLKELQYIADSADVLRRNRGRRGLDILHAMQKSPDINVKISEEDFPAVKEVDAKLIELGKSLGAKVITNDFNLNQVAELQAVSVLNINELANAIKPVILPGETMTVRVVKEGKEYGQGVAYLDDGTMVVVDNGRSLMGQSLEVTVTSVLQTAAGRMIFTKKREGANNR
ncbi:PIN/TRAM domain-containing protein [Candidatus Poribacteria bacterium]